MKLLIMSLIVLTTSRIALQPEPTVLFSDRVEVLSMEVRDIAPPAPEPSATSIPVEVIPEIQPTSNPCVTASNTGKLLCYPEYEDQNYSYFRERAPNGKTATVVRYNPVTKIREELYTGEVEHILWVQSGYAALMMGGLGRVYVIPGEFSNATAINAALALNIIDLTTKEVIYSTPAEWFGPQSSIWTPNAFFLTPEWLQIDRRYYSDVNQVGAAKNSLVHVLTGEVVELDGLLGRNSLGNGWYVMTPPGIVVLPGRIGLYNLDTHETIAVVQLDGMMDASVGLVALPDNAFQITVQDWANDDPYGYRAVRETVYVVRINGVELT